jgi:hypothetical protein
LLRIARAGIVVWIVLAGAVPALGVDVHALGGTWRGERNGVEFVWQIDPAGRLRIDGRTATWKLDGESLAVAFDPLDNSQAVGENAVYHIQASEPGQGRRSLHVTGFDLGSLGLFLVRDEPVPPSVPVTEMAQGTGAPIRPAATAAPTTPSIQPTSGPTDKPSKPN